MASIWVEGQSHEIFSSNRKRMAQAAKRRVYDSRCAANASAARM